MEDKGREGERTEGMGGQGRKGLFYFVQDTPSHSTSYSYATVHRPAIMVGWATGRLTVWVNRDNSEMYHSLWIYCTVNVIGQLSRWLATIHSLCIQWLDKHNSLPAVTHCYDRKSLYHHSRPLPCLTESGKNLVLGGVVTSPNTRFLPLTPHNNY